MKIINIIAEWFCELFGGADDENIHTNRGWRWPL